MHRKAFLIVGILFTAISAFSPKAEAMVSPVGVSLFPPLEFPLRGSSVLGARLNIFLGIHESVYGLDVGAVGNMTDKGFGGLQVAGIFNRNKGHATILGTQIGGLGNWNLGGSDIYGLQATLGLNTNRGRDTTLVGLGIGVLGNRSQGAVVGMQIGIFNQARDVYGLQIGVCNIAKSLHGVQLGLVNINKDGPLPFFPVINAGI